MQKYDDQIQKSQHKAERSSCWVTNYAKTVVCLYILLGKVRTLMEWADGLLSKMWGDGLDGSGWIDGYIPFRLL